MTYEVPEQTVTFVLRIHKYEGLPKQAKALLNQVSNQIKETTVSAYTKIAEGKLSKMEAEQLSLLDTIFG